MALPRRPADCIDISNQKRFATPMGRTVVKPEDDWPEARAAPGVQPSSLHAITLIHLGWDRHSAN
ncbi:hypothetical protein [Synechococcus sp. UW179A]|uniref:hypothetical protein n=1 Tax=Synechococcus sp. UW179A TaxID=2575510 RepID=UPI001A7E12C1|nr:hypothetical protein [Synechococcus sp. UW179A]